jgi:hypothetical protein
MSHDRFGIVDFANEAADALASEFVDDPEAELFAWLRIAQQREAMVSEAYAPGLVDEHLAALQRDQQLGEKIVNVLRAAIGSVWAQETSHNRYLASIIRVVDPPTSFLDEVTERVLQIQGRLEGSTVAGLSSPRWMRRAIARIALTVGSLIVDVPEFGAKIKSLRFSAFCLLNAALEETAGNGYKRILHLIERVAQNRFDVRVSTVALDTGRTLSDERYHLRLFELLADWSGGDPPDPPEPPSSSSSVLATGPDDPPPPSLLQSTTSDELVTLIRNVQARIYGQHSAFGVSEPDYHFRESNDELLAEPVVQVLRERVGHRSAAPWIAEVMPDDAPLGASSNEETLTRLAQELPKEELER